MDRRLEAKMSRAQRMLVRCVEDGDEAGVQQAIQAGASVDWVEQSGWAALHRAAAQGNAGIVGLLLNYSADLDNRSAAAGEEGATPLHLAACFGNTRVIRVLLDGGADAEAVDQRGKTAVHWAALQGQLECLKVLDAYNCDLKARVSGRGTALHYAAAHGDLELVQWLVGRGVDITSKDKNGRLAKDVAKRSGHTFVQHFLKNEAERQSRKSVSKARKVDNTALSRSRPRLSTRREKTERDRDRPTPSRVTTQQQEDDNNARVAPEPSKSPPSAPKKKSWIIRSVSVGNKSGRKLQVEAMKKEMEDMEESLRKKDSHIALLQGDICSLELEKGKLEEQYRVLMVQTRHQGRQIGRQDAVDYDNRSSVSGHTNTEALLQEKASLLLELQDVKRRLDEERRARVSERQASDQKIASLTSELEEVTLKMTKYGVRQRKLLSKNKATQPDLAAALAPSGIPDLGDGGCLNSVVQCLYSVTDFRNYLTSDAYKRDLVSRGEAATALAGIFKALRAGVQPEIHAKTLQLKEVVGGSRRDSHILLTYLFTRLQRDLWQVDEDSVSRKFLGSQVTVVECRWTGMNVTRVAEDFSTISLNATKEHQSSIQSLLSEHFQPLNVEQDCSHCVRSHQCRKEIKIVRLPPVLVIHLVRDDQGNNIAFPPHLSLQAVAKCNGPSYELFGVIALSEQHDSPRCTAFCRSPPDPSWHHYDGDRVLDASTDTVLGSTTSVQLLFYSAEKHS